MSKSTQKIITELEQEKVRLETDNNSLKNRVSELVNEVDAYKNKYNDDIKNLKISHKDDYDHLKETDDIEIKELKEKNLLQNEQLNKKELKKLAAAYAEEEGCYKTDSSFWGKWILGIITLIVISYFVSFYFSYSKLWYDKFEYYIVEVILFSGLWFCSSRYSDSINSKKDYGNRKTLAQSFSNILNSLEENEVIKNKFIEKTIDVLCSLVTTFSKEPLLSKEIIKLIPDIVKASK